MGKEDYYNDSAASRQKDNRRLKKVRSVVLWTVVIGLMIFLMLFCASKIGQFESIGDMFRFIGQWF